MLTPDEIAKIKLRTDRWEQVSDPIGSYLIDDYLQDTRKLLDEIERIKLDATAKAYNVAIDHQNEIESLKIEYARKAFGWQTQHEREVSDLQYKLLMATAPSLGQDLP
jgi:hypothetical protein